MIFLRIPFVCFHSRMLNQLHKTRYGRPNNCLHLHHHLRPIFISFVIALDWKTIDLKSKCPILVVTDVEQFSSAIPARLFRMNWNPVRAIYIFSKIKSFVTRLRFESFLFPNINLGSILKFNRLTAKCHNF